jgi:hypothetical protein
MIFGEDEPQPQPKPPQKVQFDTSRMETIYANFFALAGSPEEIVIYLGANSPFPNQAEPRVTVSHRLMLLPPNAKRLMIALQQTVRAHEDRFGPIELPPPPRPGGA